MSVEISDYAAPIKSAAPEDPSMDSDWWDAGPGAQRPKPEPAVEAKAPRQDDPEEEPLEEVEAPEAEEAPEEEVPEVTEPDAEAPEGLSTRAQKRFQEIASDRKALRQELDQSRQAVMLLQQQIAMQTQLQQQVEARQQAAHQAQQKLAQDALQMQALQEAGFNPQLMEHQFMLQERQQRAALEVQLAEIQGQMQQAKNEAHMAKWQSAIGDQLTKRLGEFEVSATQQAKLGELAMAQAIAFQLTDPADAVARVIDPLKESLRPKVKAAKTPKGIPATETKAHDAIAMDGGNARGSNRKPGDSVATGKKRESIDDLEGRIFGKRGW